MPDGLSSQTPFDKRAASLIVECMAFPATLQDVADHADVHRTTVSLALRDHPSIPPVTRDRIKAIAAKLGYRANPLVTALMRSRRTGKAVKHAVLAYVTNHPTRYGWRPPALHEPDFFPGAAKRAEELGYKLEHFWMAEPGLSAARFSNILSTRGIHGLIIGRLPDFLYRLDLAWERFSAVAMGLTLQSPRLHHVAENHYFTTYYAMEQCLARSYRRIGLVFSTPNNYPRVGDRWLGGYFSQLHHLRPSERIPPYEQGPDNAAAFQQWFRRWKPEAILASRAELVIAWLEAAGLRVPHDVGLVELRNEQPELGHAGLYHDPGRIGALGVEMLVGLIHRQEIGIPFAPHETLLPGEWREGTTLPPREATSAVRRRS